MSRAGDFDARYRAALGEGDVFEARYTEAVGRRGGGAGGDFVRTLGDAHRYFVSGLARAATQPARSALKFDDATGGAISGGLVGLADRALELAPAGPARALMAGVKGVFESTPAIRGLSQAMIASGMAGETENDAYLARFAESAVDSPDSLFASIAAIADVLESQIAGTAERQVVDGPYQPSSFMGQLTRSVVESAPITVSGVAAAMVNPAVGVLGMVAAEADEAANEMYLDGLAAGMGSQDAAREALIAGALYVPIGVVLERVGLGPILKSTPFWSAFKNGVTREAVKRFASGMVQTATVEGFTEAAQSLVLDGLQTLVSSSPDVASSILDAAKAYDPGRDPGMTGRWIETVQDLASLVGSRETALEFGAGAVFGAGLGAVNVSGSADGTANVPRGTSPPPGAAESPVVRPEPETTTEAVGQPHASPVASGAVESRIRVPLSRVDEQIEAEAAQYGFSTDRDAGENFAEIEDAPGPDVSFAFSGELPTEIRDAIKTEPPAVRMLFQKNMGRGAMGADWLSYLGSERMLELARGAALRGTGSAARFLEDVARGADERLRVPLMIRAINLNKAKEAFTNAAGETVYRKPKRTATSSIQKPASLPIGSTFTIEGVSFEVVFESETDQKQLFAYGDTGTPWRTFPINDGTGAIPVDPGSLTVGTGSVSDAYYDAIEAEEALIMSTAGLPFEFAPRPEPSPRVEGVEQADAARLSAALMTLSPEARPEVVRAVPFDPQNQTHAEIQRRAAESGQRVVLMDFGPDSVVDGFHEGGTVYLNANLESDAALNAAYWHESVHDYFGRVAARAVEGAETAQRDAIRTLLARIKKADPETFETASRRASAVYANESVFLASRPDQAVQEETIAIAAEMLADVIARQHADPEAVAKTANALRTLPMRMINDLRNFLAGLADRIGLSGLAGAIRGVTGEQVRRANGALQIINALDRLSGDLHARGYTGNGAFAVSRKNLAAARKKIARSVESLPTRTIEAEFGRPDLVNPGITPESQSLIDRLDEFRNYLGLPDRRTLEQVTNDADRIIADTEAVGRLVDRVMGGQLLNDAETVALGEVLSASSEKMVTAGDGDSFRDAAVSHYAFRQSGTDVARALGARRVFRSNPREVRRRAVADLLTRPGRTLQRDFDRLQKNIDEARRGENPSRLRELEARRNALIDRHADEIRRTRERLQKAGYDLETLTPEHFADPAFVAPFVRIAEARGADAFDMLFELKLAAMLSGPLTHAANITGNTINMFIEMAMIRPVEAVVNEAVGKLTGETADDAVTLAELPAVMRSIGPALSAAVRNLLRAYATERPQFAREILDQQTGKFDLPPGAIPGVAGRVIRAPSLTSLLAADEFFKTLAGTMAAHGLAHRFGRTMQRRLNWTDEVRDQFSAALIADPTSEVWEMALDDAIRLTFQQKTAMSRMINGVLGSIETADLGAPMLWRFIGTLIRMVYTPFIKTPINLYARGLQLTPGLSLIHPLYRAAGTLVDLVTNNRNEVSYRINKGQLARDAAIITVSHTVGLYVLASIFGMLDDDDEPTITGAAPLSPGHRQLADRLEARPNHIKIAGHWIPYARLDPIATTLQVAVSGAESLKASLERGENAAESVIRAVSGVAVGIARSMTDKTFLREIGELIEAMSDPERGGERAVTSLVRSLTIDWVPNLIRQPSRQSDTVIRQRVDTLRDEGMWSIIEDEFRYNAMPGFDRALPASVDLWGRDRVRGDGDPSLGPTIYRIISPLVPSVADEYWADAMLKRYNDRVELGELGEDAKAYAPVQPWNTLTYRGVRYRLDPTEYNEYLRERGRTAKRIMDGIRDRLDTENPGEREVEAVRRAMRRSSEVARESLVRRMIDSGRIRP